MAKTKPTTITIPTESELGDRLAGIDRLLTAKRWERAAIVWAFTIDDDEGGRPPETEETGSKAAQFPETLRGFARLGFAGLSERHTVAHYRQAWQTAIDQGKAREVHPGDEVELPDLLWPPSWRTEFRDKQPHAEELKAAADEAGIKSSTVLDVASNTEALKAAIRGSAEVRRAAVAAIREDPTAIQAVIAEDPTVMKTAIMENPAARKVAIEAMNEAAERSFAGKEPRPDPDDREFTAQWNAMNVARRVNTGLTELIRLTRDLALTGDEFHQGLTHQVNSLKVKADALYSMVHDGAAFDAALQELLDSDQ